MQWLWVHATNWWGDEGLADVGDCIYDEHTRHRKLAGLVGLEYFLSENFHVVD